MIDLDEIVLSIKLNLLERCFLESSMVDYDEVLSTVEML